MHVCLYVCMYRRFGGERRPLGCPPTGKSDSVRSCVRAGEAACLRERDYAPLRWPTDSRIVLLRLRLKNAVFTLVSLICLDNCCYMHGFDAFSLIFVLFALVL